MFKLISLFLLFAILNEACGHNFGENFENLLSVNSAYPPHQNKILSDADLQSALMPQELNPAITYDKLFQDAPWRAVLPLGRQRRDAEVVADVLPPPPATTVSQSLKLYSRVATCVALAVGAIVEIILYVVEYYTVA